MPHIDKRPTKVSSINALDKSTHQRRATIVGTRRSGAGCARARAEETVADGVMGSSPYLLLSRRCSTKPTRGRCSWQTLSKAKLTAMQKGCIGTHLTSGSVSVSVHSVVASMPPEALPIAPSPLRLARCLRRLTSPDWERFYSRGRWRPFWLCCAWHRPPPHLLQCEWTRQPPPSSWLPPVRPQSRPKR